MVVSVITRPSLPLKRHLPVLLCIPIVYMELASSEDRKCRSIHSLAILMETYRVLCRSSRRLLYRYLRPQSGRRWKIMSLRLSDCEMRSISGLS